MNVAKGRDSETSLPYQMEKIETESRGHLSNCTVFITLISKSPTSSGIISRSSH